MKKCTLIAIAFAAMIVFANWLPVYLDSLKLEEQVAIQKKQLEAMERSSEKLQEAMEMLRSPVKQ